MVHEVLSIDEITRRFESLRNEGWIPKQRPTNDGGAGNTLEDALGIPENNFQTADAGEWELKTHGRKSSSLLTALHSEPFPRDKKWVPSVLLPYYGWAHKEAGEKYPADERSFRQTIHAQKCSDRGFRVVVDFDSGRVEIQFDSEQVDERHSEWLAGIQATAGLGDLDPRPYWTMDKISERVLLKLKNVFHVVTEHKTVDRIRLVRFGTATLCHNISMKKYFAAMGRGDIFVEFDARTGHNHGTKNRFRNLEMMRSLYEKVEEI